MEISKRRMRFLEKRRRKMLQIEEEKKKKQLHREQLFREGFARITDKKRIKELGDHIYGFNEKIGGKLGEFIKEVLGKEYECECDRIGIVNVYGYRHEDGLEDSEGRRWWIFAHCGFCKTSVSWTSLKNAVKSAENKFKVFNELNNETQGDS